MQGIILLVAHLRILKILSCEILIFIVFVSIVNLHILYFMSSPFLMMVLNQLVDAVLHLERTSAARI